MPSLKGFPIEQRLSGRIGGNVFLGGEASKNEQKITAAQMPMVLSLIFLLDSMRLQSGMEHAILPSPANQLAGRYLGHPPKSQAANITTGTPKMKLFHAQIAACRLTLVLVGGLIYVSGASTAIAQSLARPQGERAHPHGLWLTPRFDSRNQARAGVASTMKNPPREVWRMPTGGKSGLPVPFRLRGGKQYCYSHGWT